VPPPPRRRSRRFAFGAATNLGPQRLCTSLVGDNPAQGYLSVCPEGQAKNFPKVRRTSGAPCVAAVTRDGAMGTGPSPMLVANMRGLLGRLMVCTSDSMPVMLAMEDSMYLHRTIEVRYRSRGQCGIAYIYGCS
jgi:hypothetical protein